MPALLLILLLPCFAFAQPDTTWSRSFLINDRSFLFDSEIVSDSIIVACGYSQTGLDGTNKDYLICGYTTSGDSLYARTLLETDDIEVLEGLTLLGGDTVVAVGWSVNIGRAVNLVAFRAGTGEFLWSKTYSQTARTKGRDICTLADGRLAVTGYHGGTGNQSDMWLLLCNTLGDTIWTRTTGVAGGDVGNAITQLPNGNLRIAGAWRSGTQSDYDHWSTTYDLNGNHLGADLFTGTGGDDLAYNLIEDPLNRMWLIGSTASAGNAGYTTVIPTAGAPFSLTFQSAGFSDQFRSGIPWFGGMLFAGRSGNVGSNTSFLMRAIDADNLTRWTWRYGSIASEAGFNNVIQLPSGGALAVGAQVEPSDTSVIRAYLLAILPPSGVQGVVTSLNDDEPVVGARVQALGDPRVNYTNSQGIYRIELPAGFHDIVVSGFCIETDTLVGVEVIESGLAEGNIEVGEPAFLQLQSSINIIAQNQIEGGTTFTLVNSGSGILSYSVEAEAISPAGSWITVNPASGNILPSELAEIVVVVNADTSNEGVFEFLGEITIHSNVCPDTVVTLPVLVSVLDADLPPTMVRDFSLSPAYPNPFNSNTSLTLSIPTETDIRVEVFNIAGQAVQTILDDHISAGNHTINISLIGQTTGLYIVRAETKETSAVQKLLYIR